MEYMKPFLTYNQQAERLIEERGMIADKADLIRHLEDVGYYRLSGYWHIYKKPGSDEFWEGTTFQRVWDAYVFDRQFRLIVFDAIERVEVYMRTQLAYELAATTSPFGYLNKDGLPRLNDQQYDHFIDKCNEAYSRARKGEPFAKHFQEKYGDMHDLPPYWILVNVMDFGMVVTLYKGAPVPVRKKIAGRLNVSTKVLDSWLVTINTVRNICAHQGRLWNRILGNPPMIPKAEIWHEPYEVANDKIFGTLTVLSYLLERIAPDTSWRKRLLDKVETLTKRNQERMGFTEGWQKCSIWRPWIE
ncbi:Abi family protein [Adlercreutzia agrestimuris]|uniref:Abi family protein n=1 Tax=Adlercreutzia agrestimuris TaxID=2941324 RepID=UPI00203EEC64|nr:Abi family protein [Adlercreutzia agrestimuris]